MEKNYKNGKVQIAPYPSHRRRTSFGLEKSLMKKVPFSFLLRFTFSFQSYDLEKSRVSNRCCNLIGNFVVGKLFFLSFYSFQLLPPTFHATDVNMVCLLFGFIPTRYET